MSSTYQNEAHYDVLDYCTSNEVLFVDGNILKYLLRNKNQDEQDIEKALVYRRLYQYTIELYDDDFLKLCTAYGVSSNDLGTFLSPAVIKSDKRELALTIKKQAVEHANRS